ncbi:hypothetical protein B9Z55_025741 [Caenorhabditis nigoni]|uniref:Uncharacterized protein n=1 Tax=Caenorhabditis nigoni TaxID=1611254 RepID=A0A2G5T0C9_9PELO|nr:hypothetical protein B9Z55_025741 [Caenorhabditis nigoni]
MHVLGRMQSPFSLELSLCNKKLIVAANEALAAASSDSPDVLTALKTLGPKAAALFKSFLPIGSIMTRNPKYKELTNFHRRSDTLWRNFSKEFETSVEFFIMLFDYNMEVTDPMDYLSDYSGQYYDPNDYKRSDFMTKFERLCSNLSSYVYEVLIVREAANKYESYFNGDDTRCSFHKHNSGFNTIIGRIPFNSDDQYGKRKKPEMFYPLFNKKMNHILTVRLGKLIEKQRAAASEVIQTIQSEMNNLYADPTLPMIADSLKEKIGKDIITNYGFSCWAIIREWRWMPCPEITYGSSPFKINDFESITTLRYKNRGEITQDCEDFRFFFFV